MSYKHGIYVREIPTKVIPPAICETGLPVVFGTAPIHLAQEPALANEPQLIYSYEQAVKRFGYSDNWEKYTLCEFMYSQFALHAMAPVVLVNVLDENKHVQAKTEDVKVENGKGKLATEDVLPASLVLKNQDGSKTYRRGQDYQLMFDEQGRVNIAAVREKMEDGTIKAEFSALDPLAATAKDIIGGIDIVTGKKKGLELISEVFPRFRLVPGLILAPKFSQIPEVAAIMESKARNVNGIFKAMALIDAPTNLNPTEVPDWKNKNNVVSEGQIVCYPKIMLGGKVYHLSTQLAGVINATDKKYDDIPYKSPSNELLKMNGTLNDRGDLFLGQEEANYLNGQGVFTALNFIGGWKTWGNRTAAYPGVTDVKDSFIPIRRMFDWVANTLILTYWQKIDDPMNKRLIDTVVESANIWLNSLVAIGALLGGRVQVLKDENPVTDLMDGKIHFHLYMTPPSPAREIQFIQEYDVNYVTSFIESIAD